MSDRESLIRQRAYEIWEREGRPLGRDFEHWCRAESEVAVPAAPEPIVAPAPAPAKKPRKAAAPKASAAVAAAAPKAPSRRRAATPVEG